jgi:hypothetical protein
MKLMKQFYVAVMLAGCSIASQVTAQQQPTVKFYCGQSFDPNSNKILPTTLVATSAKKEPVAFIKWKSTAFGKHTPQNRCDIVSPKLQQAWENKQLNYLIAGTSKRTGQGIICGASDRYAKCNESSMLFTLANGADARDVIERINGIRVGQSSDPIVQNSGEGLADIQVLLKQLSEE